MSRLRLLLAFALLPAATLAATTFAAAAPAQSAGAALSGDLWLNPHRSVAVRTGPCGEQLCGWIAWANAEAIADARDGGADRLVGTALLQDYHADGVNRWKGTVFVPDMGRSFASQIEVVGPGALRVKGCILGGLICKSQVWTRIQALPRD